MQLFPILALTIGSAAASSAQTSLEDTPPGSFISSSIFGRKLHSDAAKFLEDPIPPSYYPRDFNDEGEYSGVDTFAHLPFTNCFIPEANQTFDVAIVGAPFDLGKHLEYEEISGPAINHLDQITN